MIPPRSFRLLYRALYQVYRKPTLLEKQEIMKTACWVFSKHRLPGCGEAALEPPSTAGVDGEVGAARPAFGVGFLGACRAGE